MRYILIFFIVFFYCCKTEKKQQDIFELNLKQERYPLDIAIEKSQKEEKPILLWVSIPGNSTDVALMRMQRQIDGVRKYMLDSMIYCRLIVGNKRTLRAVKNPMTKALFPSNMKFKTEGKLNEWICNEYFEGSHYFLVVINSQLKKMTAFHYNKDFDHDTTSFLDFLKEGYREYITNKRKK